MFLSPARTISRLLRPTTTGILPASAATSSAALCRVTFPIFRSLQYSSSSSKPSSPSDGSRTITPTTSSRRRGSFSTRKIATRISGAGLGLYEPNNLARLPSVPNTSHLIPAELAASSFFALHRPVSITDPVPKIYTESAFSSIFDTLLDSPDKPAHVTQNPPAGPATEGDGLIPDLNTLFSSIKHGHSRDAYGEYTEASIQLPSQLLAPHSYKPFHPPPAPEPYSKKPAVLAHAQLAIGPGPTRQMITIFQSTDLNGMTTLTARMSEVPSYINRIRMSRRKKWKKERMENPRDREDISAISVKRRRRLKMKKHKYKKLRKLTRNSRRRLEKQ